MKQPVRRQHSLLSGTIVTSFGTLVSRVLGMLRDMATASLFGLAAGGVMDAFVVAFRIPNLFRRMFGEGALTASYLPVFARTFEHDPQQAWRVASATMAWVAMVLTGVVLVGEVGLAIWVALAADSRVTLLAGLTAMLLPYVLIVCQSAIAAASLQSLGKFALQGFAPAILNIFWLLGTIVVAPQLAQHPADQARILAGCVLVGGACQWLVLLWALRRGGFRFRWRASDAAAAMRQIRAGMLPAMLGLAVTQLNSLVDSWLAWGLAAPADGPQTIAWLGDVAYPMRQGAASAIYFGERMYQFPLGLLGVAVATVVFPLLSRHAARGDYVAVRDDLVRGLRLVLLLALPASAGLALLAEPIAQLLFQRGQFTAEDADRTAAMIAIYGCGVLAFCAAPVLVRAFYAVNDRAAPVRIAVAAVSLNLVLSLSLMWVLAERGMAVSTVTTAVVQVIALLAMFSRGHVALPWPALAASTLRVGAATAMTTLAGWMVLERLSHQDGASALVRVLVPLGCCIAVYGVLIGLFARGELRGLGMRRASADL